jgi:hypothetical protein
VAGGGIEDPSARDELECGIGARAVDELVRKVRLLVHALSDDGEDQLSPVRQRHVHPVPKIEFVQFEKDRSAVIVVNVAQNDRGSLLARRRVAVVPAGLGKVGRNVDGSVLVER